MLLQQTANWLLNSCKEGRTVSPFGSLNFLKDAQVKSSLDFDDYFNPKDILRLFQALTVRLIGATQSKIKACLLKGLDEFTARNESQFFAARTLSLVFIQMTMLDRFIIYCEEFEGPEKAVMCQLASIYGLWSLEKHLGHLFQFQILANKHQVDKIHDSLLELCKGLTANAVALVDVLAPPDFILNSVLGNSDGDVYKHLQQSFYETDNSFGRAKYRVLENSKL